MDILFYAILTILFFIAPIFLRVEGTFSPDRKLAYATIRLFGMKILSLGLYFHAEGVMISLWGRPAKGMKGKGRKKGRSPLLIPYIQMIRFKEIKVTAYVGGDPTPLSLALGAILLTVEEGMDLLRRKRLLDRSSIRILPCYVGKLTTVNFSITFFTSVAQLLGALVHTKRGNDYGERSDREYDGENA